MARITALPRRLVVACAEPRVSEAWLAAQLPDVRAGVLWIARQAPEGIDAVGPSEVLQRLGDECRLLVYNAFDGFHPDAFAAALGMLRGGGDCVLLAPPLGGWAGFADPDRRRFAAYPHLPDAMHGYFLERLARIWGDHPAVHVWSPGETLRVRLAPVDDDGGFALHDEQRAVVAAIERVAHGHARRPLLLTADRGRGKSTALGIAAARLLLDGLPRVSVVAPHRAAAATLFRHAAAHAGIAFHGVADLAIGDGELRFCVPVDLVDGEHDAPGLVIFDEAAALPVAVLGDLLERANRLVFATTVHGYEGSGRGFELRFRALLDRRMPHWRALHLTMPARWPADDPLEAATHAGFLLDVELDESPPAVAPVIDVLGPTDLLASESLLRAVFGLLVNAHYQTRPSDLRQLLDNPDVSIWIARAEGAVVGVLQCVTEGGFDASMAQQVLNGARRPRGHLLPQSLAVHAGIDAVLAQKVLRIQRIAVHPQRRRQGIARALLEAAAARAGSLHYDLLGCAFAADAPLFAFWDALGFAPARLGVRIDPASAAHTLFMLRGLSEAGQALSAEAARCFRADLPWSLGAIHAQLDAGLAADLLRGRNCEDLTLSADDLETLRRIVIGVRPVETAAGVLWRALLHIAADGVAATDALAPLLAWRLQCHSVASVCRRYAIQGGRALEQSLFGVLAALTGAGPVQG